jgi:hypothetical protein
MKFNVDTGKIVTALIIAGIISAVGFSGTAIIEFQDVKAQGLENKRGIEVVVRLLCKHLIKKDDTICYKYLQKDPQ